MVTEEERFLEIFTSRRGHFQIIAEILELCIRPQKKTRIMYEVYLSFSQSKMYLNKLQKAGLMKLHHSEERYVTTEKGFQFLQKWIVMRQMFLDKGDLSLIWNPILTKNFETPLVSISKEFFRPKKAG